MSRCLYAPGRRVWKSKVKRLKLDRACAYACAGAAKVPYSEYCTVRSMHERWGQLRHAKRPRGPNWASRHTVCVPKRPPTFPPCTLAYEIPFAMPAMRCTWMISKSKDQGADPIRLPPSLQACQNWPTIIVSKQYKHYETATTVSTPPSGPVHLLRFVPMLSSIITRPTAS